MLLRRPSALARFRRAVRKGRCLPIARCSHQPFCRSRGNLGSRWRVLVKYKDPSQYHLQQTLHQHGLLLRTHTRVASPPSAASPCCGDVQLLDQAGPRRIQDPPRERSTVPPLCLRPQRTAQRHCSCCGTIREGHRTRGALLHRCCGRPSYDRLPRGIRSRSRILPHVIHLHADQPPPTGVPRSKVLVADDIDTPVEFSARLPLAPTIT